MPLKSYSYPNKEREKEKTIKEPKENVPIKKNAIINSKFFPPARQPCLTIRMTSKYETLKGIQIQIARI